jgi:hypothetical protein
MHVQCDQLFYFADKLLVLQTSIHSISNNVLNSNQLLACM